MKLPEFHSKEWGYEQWIANNDNYCGKLLRFVSGKSCSWHYHKLKHETFYIQEGTLDVTFGFTDDIKAAASKALYPGDIFEVPPGLRHRMTAMGGDCVMFEFSTTHFETDSYRINI